MLLSLRQSLLTGENRLNTFAALTVLFVFLVFQWNTDPEACGSDPVATNRPSAPRILLPIAAPVPVDVESIQQVVDDGNNTGTVKPAVSAEEIPSPQGTVLKDRIAIRASQKLLLQGQQFLEKTPDYLANFKRQERINGALLDPQAMSLKARHAPFSLYLKWTEGDKGRQLIFVQGLNDDNVLIQLGGIKGRLAGTLSMKPDDPRVLEESRYPATCAGLLALTKIILNHHKTDIERTSGVSCEIRDGESFDNRPCFLTTVIYDNPQVNADYHKSFILIDKELSVPVCVRNHTWVEGKAAATDDENNLIESYSYTEIQVQTQLTDNDFEKSKYKMR